MMSLRLKIKFKSILFLILWAFSGGCDFSPPLNKKILEAQSLISEQSYKEAINKYVEILDRNPSLEAKVKILYQIGELYSLYLNEPKEGIKFFKKVIKETDELPWLVRSEEKIASINFNNLKNFSESYESYKRLSSFRPSLKKKDYYEFQMGLCLHKNDEFENAIKIFEKISRSSNNKYSINSLYYAALSHFHKKNWKLAIRSLKLFIRKGKRRDRIVEAKYLLANIYETTEKLKKAYDLYYSILGEYPNTKVLKNRLEVIYQRKVVRKR